MLPSATGDGKGFPIGGIAEVRQFIFVKVHYFFRLTAVQWLLEKSHRSVVFDSENQCLAAGRPLQSKPSGVGVSGKIKSIQWPPALKR